MSIILYIVSDLKCLNKTCPLVSQAQVVGPDIQSVLRKRGDCSTCTQGGKEAKRTGDIDKVLLSPRKCINIPKRATNVDKLQKDVLHRTVLIIYSYKMVQFFPI
jgi:hypothetical protein